MKVTIEITEEEIAHMDSHLATRILMVEARFVLANLSDTILARIYDAIQDTRIESLFTSDIEDEQSKSDQNKAHVHFYESNPTQSHVIGGKP